MKKILLILTSVLVFNSCSSSDDSTQSSSSILPKKAVWNDGSVFNYFYQGNKLIKINCNDGSSTIFTYNGNFISKVEFFNQSTLVNKDEFVYTNGVLTQIKEFNNTTLYKKHDINNIDLNTKSRITTTYNSSTTTTTKYKEYFTNGVLTKQEKLNSNNSIIWTNTFTYDNQNFLYKNIIGYEHIVSWYDWGGPINNIKKVTFTQSGNTQNTNYLYQYNSEGYPIKCTISSTGSSTEIVEYTY